MRRLLALAAVVVACHRAPAERGRDGVVIAAEWPGATAEEVEQQIAIPIERAVSSAPHVVHVRTRAVAGRTTIAVEIDPGSDPFAVTEAMRGRVAETLRELPADIPRPSVGRAPGPIVLRYTLSSETLSVADMTRAGDQLTQQLYTIPGVQGIDACGERPAQIVVFVDPARLAAYGLTIGEVRGAIAKATRIDPAVLPDTALASHGGVPVYLRDVARIDNTGQGLECLALVNGRRGIANAVRVLPSTNLLELRDKLEQKLASVPPPGLQITILPRDKPLVFVVPGDGAPVERREQAAEGMSRTLASLPQVASVLVESDRESTRLLVFERDGGARDAVIRALPGVYETGDLVVQLFGDDSAKLAELAHQLAKSLGGSEVGDTRIPALHFEIDRHAAARYELDVADITEAYAAATRGVDVGTVHVQLMTASPEQALDTLLPTHVGITVPLRDVAILREQPEAIEIRREDGRRWVGVRTRADAAAARDAIAKLALPAGYEARLATGEP